MFIGELILAFFVALIVALLLGGLMGWERPGAPGGPASVLFLFAIIFLATWAGGVWLVPFGPIMWGVAWLPFVAVALFVALLVAALVPPRRRRATVTEEQKMEKRAGDEAEAVLTGFFWVFVLALVAAVIIGYAA